VATTEPDAADRLGLRREDVPYLTPVRSAHVVEAAPAAMWAVYLLLVVIVAAVGWAWIAKVDIVARAPARVIPDGREQVIASFEGGILRELKVKEGDRVFEGDELALLDPTRFVAQQAEGDIKRIALRGAMARLEAEMTGGPLSFPADVRKSRQVVDGETASYRARQQALNQAVAFNRSNLALLRKELDVAQSMSAKGLMSEVEVMRLRRQVNDIELQTQERINRFRQEASAEMVKVRTELTQLEEQMVVRDDALKRTTLKSPVRGIVKTIRMNTIGGVVPAGAPVMEIVPIGPRVLVEARVRPADIGFVKVGQEVTVKLTAYEFTVYGGLKGKVQSISPDAIGDPDKPQGADGTYYRALVRAERPNLQVGGRKFEVLPGMSGTADIRTGERSVMDFIIRPMMKSQEAFRER
jgi:adhesin transport system membrane fusion protein